MSTFIWLDMTSNYLYDRFWRCHEKSVSPRETGRVLWNMNCLRSLGITFCFSGFGFDLFGYFILVESQNVSPFLVWFISLNITTIRFIHIVALSELPTLKGRKRFHCVSTTVCLWNWLSMDTQIASVCWPVWITLLWLWLQKYAFFSAPFSKPFGYIAWIRIEISVCSMC